MGRQDLAVRLETILRDWPGITSAPHRNGGVEFRVNRREVGHVHPSGILDLPFPVRMRRELVAAGRAEAHHMLPNTGWVTFRLRTEHDVPAAVALLRLNYDRLCGHQTRPNLLPLLGPMRLIDESAIDEELGPRQ